MKGSGFWVDLDNLSSVQADSLRSLVRRAKHAHYATITLRENGRNTEFTEADWLKHLEPRPDYKRLFLRSVKFMRHSPSCLLLAGPADVGAEPRHECDCGYEDIIRDLKVPYGVMDPSHPKYIHDLP